MNEQRIREIANQASTHAEDTVDYYSGIVDGLTWEAKILKARDLKFAELIVRDCAEAALAKGRASPDTDFRTGSYVISEYLLSRFGVEQ